MVQGRYTSLSLNEWQSRCHNLTLLAQSCALCPRGCGVNRLANERGQCGAGKLVSLVSYGPHHGEEPCFSGRCGSGTLFFGHCNLHCVYCQNADISQDHELARTYEVTEESVAEAMLSLQRRGCHNINWVSPTHQIAGIFRALLLAWQGGLTLPIVYNTHSYDSLDVLHCLDGIVDIYLPDLKYANNRVAERFGAPSDYVQRAREAIKEMYRQVGGLRLDPDGVAISGVLVRLLVLPHDLSGTRNNLRWLASEVGTDIAVNVMAQYHPAYKASLYPELLSPLDRQSYISTVLDARELGFHVIYANSFL